MYGTVPELHALTNDVVLADPNFIRSATAVMHACRSRIAIHLRAADTSSRRLLELALELRVVSETTGSWVLINDRVDIAMVSGVSGAQLTSRSLTIADARRIAPTMILGASVHATADAWMAAFAGLTAARDASLAHRTAMIEEAQASRVQPAEAGFEPGCAA